MDTVNVYRDLIEQIITDHARIPYALGDIGRQMVFDRRHDHYLLMIAGWDQGRVHGCIIHVDLLNGKFWIQRDGTEYGVAQELLDAGIPRTDIVLAFQATELRKYSPLAEA